jgi:hypothetical protein
VKKRDIIFVCVLIGIIVGAFFLLFPAGGVLPIPTKVATLQVHGKIDTMGGFIYAWTVDASVSDWHTGIPGFLTLDPLLADFYHTVGHPPLLALLEPVTFEGVFRLTSWTTKKTINKYFSFTQPAGVIWYTGEGTVTFNAVPAGSYTLKLELKGKGEEESHVLGEWQLALVEGQEGAVALT